MSFSTVISSPVKPAVPVLRSYLKQLRFVVGSYFDVTLSSPDAEFIAEAPQHPVFLLASNP